MRFKYLLYIISGIVLIAGISSTLYLAQTRQDSRSRAYVTEPSLSFKESNVQAKINDNVSFSVIYNSGTSIASDMQLEITFDPSILTPSDNGFIVKSPFTIKSGPEMTSGKIVIGLQTNSTAPLVNTEIAVLTFKALSITNSAISVGFGSGTSITENGQLRLVSSLTPVSVMVVSETVLSPTVNLSVSITPTITPVPSLILYSIRGKVFEDSNRNGVMDDERIFDALRINILGGPNNSVQGSVLTNSDGEFNFENLPAGSYRVTSSIPQGFTATTPVFTNLTLPAQNNFIQFGFAPLATSYFLERFPWSHVTVPNFNPYRMYMLLRYRMGYSADVVKEQGGYEYRWSSSDESIATISPYAECTNGIVPPCPYDHLVVNGHRAGPVIIRLSVVDKATNLEVANNYFIVTIKAPEPTPTVRMSTPSFPLNVYLHGIGNSGDRVSSSSANSNRDPINKVRSITLELYNSQNNLVNKTSGDVTYSSASGNFQGTINVTTPLQPGSYIVKASMQKYLRKNLYDILVLPPAGQIAPRTITLVAGDLNSDNKINILDYNILIPCYSDVLEAKSCSPENKKLADLNDDGLVNFIDYNLFLREYSEQTGE